MLSRIFPDTRPITCHRLRGAGYARMQTAIATIAILILLCLQSFAQQLVINEVLREPTQPTDSSWVELYNGGTEVAEVSSYALRVNTHDLIPLGDVSLQPSGFLIIPIPRTTDEIISSVSLVQLQDDQIIDEVNLVIDPFPGESVGRVPDGFGEFIIMPAGKVTPARPNASPGPWVKHANSTAFSPRDSSPNACVVHRDSVWVFAGYRYVDGDWFSRSDVYKSADAKVWEVVNPNPPYDPYSAFVSFKDTIRAFGTNSYYSIDGIEWTPFETSLSLTEGMRATVFDGAIWILRSNSIYRSTDAVNWEIVNDNVPWGSRDWPAFLSFKNKLWMIGGGIGYGEDNLINFNDVWSSEDGVNWTQVTSDAKFPPRYWFNALAFDGKLWILGGWQVPEPDDDQYGNRNDVWVSSDGENWVEMFTHTPWGQRHAMFAFEFRNRLWISAGYGHLGLSRIYNDVWSLDGNTWFAKPGADLTQLIGWSSNPDGDGSAPESFDLAGQLFFLGLGSSVISDTLTIKGTGSSLIVASGERIEVTETGLLRSEVYLNEGVELKLKNSFAGRMEGSMPRATYDMSVNSFTIEHDNFTSLRIENAHNPLVSTDSVAAEELLFENTTVSDSLKRSFRVTNLLSLDSKSSLHGLATELAFVGEDPRIVNEGSDTIVIQALQVALRSGDLRTNSPIRSGIVELSNGRIILEGGPMQSDVFLNPSIQSYIVTSRNNYIETAIKSETHIIPVGNLEYFAPVSIRGGFKYSPNVIRVYVEPFGVISNDTVNVIWSINSSKHDATVYTLDFAWYPFTGEDIGGAMDTVSVFSPYTNRVRGSFTTGDSTGISRFMTPLPIRFAVRRAVSPEKARTPAMSVFPNPCTDVLYILHSSEGQQTINVLNANGQRLGVERETVAVGEILNTSLLPPGLYILEIIDGEQKRFVKFIKR